METLDIVNADEVEPGDNIRVDGQEFHVVSVDDLGDEILARGYSLDDNDDTDEIPLVPDQRVEILGYSYEED